MDKDSNFIAEATNPEPWIALRRGPEQCRAACRHPEYLLLVAHAEGAPCGFILLHPRGVSRGAAGRLSSRSFVLLTLSYTFQGKVACIFEF